MRRRYSANRGEERLIVTLVKCRPALGSTPQNTFAVPRRSYSLSRRATRPGFMATGGRTSRCKTTGFSSSHTTGSFSESGFSYTASTSSMRAIYSSSSVGTHHIFFPPRLEIVGFQQDPDGLPAHAGHQLALHYLFHQQAHRPTRPTFRWLTASQGNDALLLLGIE